jgi:hypothetical protein
MIYQISNIGISRKAVPITVISDLVFLLLFIPLVPNCGIMYHTLHSPEIKISKLHEKSKTFEGVASAFRGFA